MKPNPSTDSSMEQILASIRQSITEIAEEGAAGGRIAPAMNAGPVAVEGRSGEAPERVVELRPRQDERREPAVEPSTVAAIGESPEPVRPEPRFGYTLRREGAPRVARPSEAGGKTRNEAQPGPANEARRPAAQSAERPAPPAPIMSAATDATVSKAFNHLADTLLSGEARTLEDLVREMLRPMLKTWLDSNLPPLVERLVREEIERVARGQRHA